MRLVYDLQAMECRLTIPGDGDDREIQRMTIAEAIPVIEGERRRRRPKWKRYYHSHREKELARQRRYRADHRDHVREYNRQYYQARKRQKALAEGQAVLAQEAAG
ncbi:MAG TPA: hypothetical protein PKY15_01400 [Methanoregulaceae archaeon]|nr:hypothetical protein [Methanoregulaceae archaeon]